MTAPRAGELKDLKKTTPKGDKETCQVKLTGYRESNWEFMWNGEKYTKVRVL